MEDQKLPTPASIVKDLNIFDYSVGVTGTIKKYFNRPCVVCYAKSNHHCYMIIKMQRGYKGLFFLGGDKMYSYFNCVGNRTVQNALKSINDTIKHGIKTKEIEQRYIDEITANMV